jgi:hypothetical protein
LGKVGEGNRVLLCIVGNIECLDDVQLFLVALHNSIYFLSVLANRIGLKDPPTNIQSALLLRRCFFLLW